jgi:hypothetical protein
MDETLLFGLLIAMGLFVTFWFVFVVPSERRHHERKLAVIQKRLAEKERLRNERPVASSDDEGVAAGRSHDSAG